MEIRSADGAARSARAIKDLTLGELAVTNSSVLRIDHGSGARNEISDVTVRLQDVSLDRPITFLLSFLLDRKPVSLEGSMGPLGKDPGKGLVPLNLALFAVKEQVMVVKGTVGDIPAQPRFDLALEVPEVSPQKLMAGLNMPVPVMNDPQALNKVSMKATVKGDQTIVALSSGVLELDDSKLAFSAKVREFAKPDVTFNLAMDKINVDRYLPPPGKENGEKEKSEETAKTTPPAPVKKNPDYDPLRKLRVNGHMKIDELTVRNARMRNIDVTITGDKGVFVVKPVHVNLYDGSVMAECTVSVVSNVPKATVDVNSHGIQVNPLLNDVMKKDILEGTALSRFDITAQGDDFNGIKRSLNGTGHIVFSDGAIKGFDLAAMVRNVKEAFTGAKTREKPRTDFTEFRVPFTITNGVLNTRDTSLKSPFIRVVATGKADLADESLDFRIEPKVVGTLKGQGDEIERSGIMIPVKVTGTFSAPRFAPDLEALLRQRIEQEVRIPSELKDTLKKGMDLKEGDTKPLEEGVRDLLRDLLEKK